MVNSDRSSFLDLMGVFHPSEVGRWNQEESEVKTPKTRH